MSELKTDEEKAEEIKEWWRENSISVISGVVLALGAVFGWQQWQSHQKEQSETASALFSQIQQQPEVIAQLKSDYSSTPYASMAALMAAKTAAENSEDEKAINELKWAIDNTSEAEVRDVAQLRLARMYIANNKLSEADSLLSKPYGKAYEALLQELKGDLFFAKKDTKQAAQAYDEAIRLSGGRAPEFLQMKRDSLGEGS